MHLLPAADGEIQTYDERGPYKVSDLAAVGGAAPARGWITELLARADGLWGKVRWTNAGKVVMSDRAYRGISPVFNHTTDNVITRVVRASLTNKPNLMGLTSLDTETSDMNLAAIAKAAGLGDDATEEAILAAIGKLKPSGDNSALQTAMTEIGVALGIQGGYAAAILAAVRSAKMTDGSITALQAELTTVTGKLTALQNEGATTKATTLIDGEIAKGRVGVKPLRDHCIAMHVLISAQNCAGWAHNFH